MTAARLPARRPAEVTTGVAAALATLASALWGPWEPQVYGAVVVVIGALPAAVSWLVDRVRTPPLLHGGRRPR